MSAGGAFGGARGNAPKPPEKGVFPLDHLGECKEVCGREVVCGAVFRSMGGGNGINIVFDPLPPPSPQLKEAYTACLRASAADADACVAAARAYLTCRMERGLMARQGLDELGVEASAAGGGGGGGGGAGKDSSAAPAPAAAGPPPPPDDRVRRGFVAGLRPGRGGG
jgi:cytochrome c oxidase assembly protein subunit 19